MEKIGNLTLDKNMQNQSSIPPLPSNPAATQAPNVPAKPSDGGGVSGVPGGAGGSSEGVSGGGVGGSNGGVSGGSNEGVSGGSNEGQRRQSRPGGNGGEDLLPKVLEKIDEGENVLVALSNDPSVDEMAAAIALTIALDGDGKHATAIYSGKTPNVLEFLKPEDTFEVNTNSLQDFIIALNKDKADHLRYKVDGDYVKVFITPYKTTLDEGDLEFSRGDYNVDLVISMNVPAATELDGALKEYGRIMHDATSVNITNGAAGKFGDVEWVDSSASSISEMVARLIYKIDENVDSRIATALLAGLVSATDKFSNGDTTPETMKMAGKLMEAGADQRDIIKNISQDLSFSERKDFSEKKISDESSKEEGKDDSKKGKSKQDKEVSSGNLSEEKGSGEFEGEFKVDQSVPEEPKPVNPPAPVGFQAQAAEMAGIGTMAGASLNGGGSEGTGAGVNGGVQGGAGGMTVAGVQTSSVPDGGYSGGDIANQILNNLQGGASGAGGVGSFGGAGGAGGAGSDGDFGGAGNFGGGGNDVSGGAGQGIGIGTVGTDYGKMIDEALAEPLPGEGGVSGVGMNGGVGNDLNGGMNGGAGFGTGMNNNAGFGGGMGFGTNNPGAGVSGGVIGASGANNGEMAGTLLEGANGGELPKITPTGGMLDYQSPMEQQSFGPGGGVSEDQTLGTPNGNAGMGGFGLVGGVPERSEVAGGSGVPDVSGVSAGVNGGETAGGAGIAGIAGGVSEGVGDMGAGLPMPGQEIVPPPIAPMPDFGSLPPVRGVPEAGVQGGAGFGAGASVGAGGAETSVGVGGAQGGMAPVLPEVPGTTGDSGAPNPGAFKIPGM
ncbi:hypothetical protein IKG02_01000 [Candidatus Saccharibacteria bacterium]|nr:hypothetical protein [Candidatus Saccharibacteria bacterium]